MFVLVVCSHTNTIEHPHKDALPLVRFIINSSNLSITRINKPVLQSYHNSAKEGDSNDSEPITPPSFESVYQVPQEPMFLVCMPNSCSLRSR